MSSAVVLTEDPGSPATKHKNTWRVRVGHVHGTNLYFEFPESVPTSDMVLKFHDEPTVIPVSRKSLDRLSTATLRELRDCLVYSSYRPTKAGERLHKEVQSQAR